MAVRIGNEEVKVNDEYSNSTMFINHLKNTLTYPTAYYCFNYNHVKKIELNEKIIFLWLDVKGQVCYNFNLLEKEVNTTSLRNLGSLLTSYFGRVIEVVNNEDEIMKKTTDRIIKVNRAITDFDKHTTYREYKESFRTDASEREIIDVDVEDNSSESLYKILSEKKQPQQRSQLQEYKKEPEFDQRQLYQRTIELSIYQLEYSHNTLYICSNQLPLVNKEEFNPAKREAFYYDKGLLIRNTYFATEHMISVKFKENIDMSFIFIFIFYMAKKDINKAMDILVWLVNIFNFLGKLPYVLTLYGKKDQYMNLFYEDLVVPLCNSKHCERVENSDLNKKTLSEKLNEKEICNYHNITSATILDEPTKEFSRKIIHKDELKINNKKITTVANTLITSTSEYIPLIANDAPSVLVDVESNISVLCSELRISNDYYVVANLIKKDLQNFAQIIRSIDMSKLQNIYKFKYYTNYSFPYILDGDADLLKVFESSVKKRYITIFESAAVNKENEALVEELKDNFDKNRIYKQNLLEYFSMLFGKHYKNNPALIKALKLISRYKEKPFDSERQFGIKGKVYYQL